MIIAWGASYGTVLDGYAAAAADLKRQLEQNGLNIESARLVQTPPSPAMPVSDTDLSQVSTPAIIQMARTSQRAIMDQIRSASNPERIKTLQALHDQLSADIADFHARAAAKA